MSLSELLVDTLLGVAVGLALVCALGLAVMRDPYQRLHFISPPATVSAFLVAAAVGLQTHQAQPLGKALLAALVLTLMNGVVTHATARAVWFRSRAQPPGSDRREGHSGEAEPPPHPAPPPGG